MGPLVFVLVTSVRGGVSSVTPGRGFVPFLLVLVSGLVAVVLTPSHILIGWFGFGTWVTLEGAADEIPAHPVLSWPSTGLGTSC
jgi:hypothetical protein